MKVLPCSRQSSARFMTGLSPTIAAAGKAGSVRTAPAVPNVPRRGGLAASDSGVLTMDDRGGPGDHVAAAVSPSDIPEETP